MCSGSPTMFMFKFGTEMAPDSLEPSDRMLCRKRFSAGKSWTIEAHHTKPWFTFSGRCSTFQNTLFLNKQTKQRAYPSLIQILGLEPKQRLDRRRGCPGCWKKPYRLFTSGGDRQCAGYTGQPPGTVKNKDSCTEISSGPLRHPKPKKESGLWLISNAYEGPVCFAVPEKKATLVKCRKRS